MKNNVDRIKSKMLAKAKEVSRFRLFGKVQLTKLRNKAMRSGMWFRALSRIDRALVNLTIRVADNIRSVTLASSIFAIIRKLPRSFESRFSYNLHEIGLPIAYKLSVLAQKWGNRSAREWVNSTNFVQYLAIIALNGINNGNLNELSGLSSK